jgi:uncharacterized protein YkwD
MSRSAFAVILAVAATTLLTRPLVNASEGDSGASGSAVVREMNLARQNPAQYASYLEEMRGQFNGNLLVRPGRIPLRTKEGAKAVDEAIRFLRSASPRPTLAFSPGMSRAAADHCAAQAGGGMSHRAGGNTGSRISRYGTFSGSWGENISCGRQSAREIVIALIIDDGLRSRKHRDNIFSTNFTVAGAATGPHAQYRTIASMAFAGGYAEHGQQPAGNLVARN